MQSILNYLGNFKYPILDLLHFFHNPSGEDDIATTREYTLLNDIRFHLSGTDSISTKTIGNVVMVSIQLPENYDKVGATTLSEYKNNLSELFGTNFQMRETRIVTRISANDYDYREIANNVAANSGKIKQAISSFNSNFVCAVSTGKNKVTPADVALLEERFAQGPMDSDMCHEIAESLARGVSSRT